MTPLFWILAVGAGSSVAWVGDSIINLGFEANNLRCHQSGHVFSWLYSKDIELGNHRSPFHYRSPMVF